MADPAAPNPVVEYLNRKASFGTDLFFACLVGAGAAVIALILPLQNIPIIGGQAPGIAGGVVGGWFLYRARANHPLNQ